MASVIRKRFSIKSIKELFRGVSVTTVLFLISLFSITAIAVLVRILPLEWGFHLSEFDPYFHYQVTEYVAENGYSSWFNWRNYQSWFPWGRDISSSSFPGLPFTAAFAYHMVRLFGINSSVIDVCIVFPVIFGAATCIANYLLGSYIGGRKVGLFSALFLALNSAHIARTSLGFFDDETVGIFSMLLLSLFYLKSIDLRESKASSVFYAIMSGVSLGYLAASWGASRYIIGLLPLFTFILLVFKRYNTKILTSYSIVVLIGMGIAFFVPKLGFKYITEPQGLVALGMILLLLVFEFVNRIEPESARKMRNTLITVIILLSSIALMLWFSGFITLPFSKFIAVVNPFLKSDNALVQSVQEHRATTWSSFYLDLGMLVFLAPIGILLAMKRPTNNNIFMGCFSLTTLYFASTLIRLTIVLAPAFCILGSYALVEILEPFVEIIKQKPFSRRRVKYADKVGRGFGIAIIVCLFLLLSYPMIRSINSGMSPTTIASSAIPVRANVDDWIEALTWMKYNLPSSSVVASWWDYGYWITVAGEKITLADNGTINGTQIAAIGTMFMSNETDALKILQKYNATHVVVFTTLSLAYQNIQAERFPILYGDEVKWTWMALIPGLNASELMDSSITSVLGLDQYMGNQLPNRDTVLTKLMVYGCSAAGALPSANSLGISLENFDLVFTSSFALVHVYEIQY